MRGDDPGVQISAKVSVLPCGSYDPGLLDRCIAQAAEAAGFPDIAGKRILVKPNLLKAAAPEEAVTTHPEFVAAVLRFLWKQGAASIQVGDSPGHQNGRAVGKASGILHAALDGGATWVDFVPGEPRPAPEARLVKSFKLASALDDCDLVVNLPKLKTHRLASYTGAIKNLFGLLPGLAKSAMHLRFSDKIQFGTMLVDLGLSIKNSFHFLDGVVAMQGEGPGNGEPYPLGLVFASNDAAALDWVAASTIGYDPRRIPYLTDAIGRSGRDPDSPYIDTGSYVVDKKRTKGFKLLPYTAQSNASLSEIPHYLEPLAMRFLAERPIFDKERCIGCSACIRICPAEALELERLNDGKYQVRIDDRACITCYCCHEVCPVGAIAIGKILWRPGQQRKHR
ncbi:MAG: DUF362 domain-containing protein [Spirochaetia bacterium]|nr:DUF362 domain-containing protein [Spirochaetia bacterium]